MNRTKLLIIPALAGIAFLAACQEEDTAKTDTTTAPVETETPKPTEDKTAPPETDSPPSTDDGEITMAEFNQIHAGMRQNEVTKIVGGAGEMLSETDIAGIHTEMRMWDGDTLAANANVMFQDGKVVSKAQFGL